MKLGDVIKTPAKSGMCRSHEAGQIFLQVVGHRRILRRTNSAGGCLCLSLCAETFKEVAAPKLSATKANTQNLGAALIHKANT